ncbi:hypothetical protein NDA18_001693 [Ustilago nuda]|nr:hypothetical protein NDA18_001693 [Ustilago nuda]
MRRAASPSKVQAKGSWTPAKRPRPDDSGAVLKTPFKPLSGLDNRSKSLPTTHPTTFTSVTVSGTQASQRESDTPSTPSAATAASSAARELRTMSTSDMQEEIDELELILSDRLARHNAARTAKGLPEQQPKQIVAEYTQLLSQYNSVKDAAQLIFDKIAEIEQLPAQAIFARYGVGEGET